MPKKKESRAKRKKKEKVERPNKKIIPKQGPVVKMLREINIHDERLLLPMHCIAKAFGVSRDAASKWDAKPVKRIANEAFYYLPEVIQIRLGNADGIKLDPSQEKAKLDKIKREKAEIEYKKAIGKVVDIKDVCSALEKELVVVRQRLLSIPTKLARPITTAKTPQEAQDMIATEVHRILEDLTDGKNFKVENTGNDSKDA